GGSPGPGIGSVRSEFRRRPKWLDHEPLCSFDLEEPPTEADRMISTVAAGHTSWSGYPPSLGGVDSALLTRSLQLRFCRYPNISDCIISRSTNQGYISHSELGSRFNINAVSFIVAAALSERLLS